MPEKQRFLSVKQDHQRKVIRLKLYHATDESRVQSILNGGFVCKTNDEHWLGNGIYFFLDYDLARWWSTNPTKKFSVKISKPAILCVDLNILSDDILDLSLLSGYLNCLDAYVRFEKETLTTLEPEIRHSLKKLRCAFFDTVFRTSYVEAIIGSFAHDDQKYLKTQPDSIIKQLRLFDLPFVEKQVCVRSGVITPDMIARC